MIRTSKELDDLEAVKRIHTGVYTRTGEPLLDTRLKKVRLTIEWRGCAGEMDYGEVMANSLERDDRSGLTLVTEIAPLTHHGRGLDPRGWKRLLQRLAERGLLTL